LLEGHRAQRREIAVGLHQGVDDQRLARGVGIARRVQRVGYGRRAGIAV
jgi:hypothetical protein